MTLSKPPEFDSSTKKSENAVVKILLVEDDSDTRAITAHTLRSDGYEISEVTDGQAAKEFCLQTRPDIIITDIMMPNLDGIGFIEWFRKEFSSHFVPILVLTALGDIEQKVRGLAVGAEDYVTKPFHHRELRARVCALVRTKILTEQLQNRTTELELAYQKLTTMQQELIDKERQLVAAQLAGTAAHNLGQPITAILLNCKLLESSIKAGEAENSQANKSTQLVQSIKSECRAVEELLQKLKSVDARQTEHYFQQEQILKLKE